LDIEMAISMAPGLSRVIVYEGSPAGTTATIDNILNRMATDNLARQISCSWGFDIDVTTQQIFQQFAAQGQSFFTASGDSGRLPGIEQPSDDPYLTIVGGTTLTTSSLHSGYLKPRGTAAGSGLAPLYPIEPGSRASTCPPTKDRQPCGTCPMSR
jgi:subtilase family serine protease